ncbi:MAG: 13E12 repeat family protein, partial [Microlunatus sp.]|nr:13E12 repeat family protein [Microlunatus sp.]
APEDRSGEDRTLVVVHVAAEHLGDQQDVEAETARRLACDVRLLGAVDADGEVLSSGRTRRLVSRAQRRALMNPGRRRVPVRELPPDSTPQSPSSRVLGGGVDRQIWTT